MALRIANPVVVGKIDRLAKAEPDRVPDRTDAIDPLPWGGLGLPT